MFSPLCGNYKREALAPLLIDSLFWVRQEDTHTATRRDTSDDEATC